LSVGAPEAAIALPWGWTWPILPFIDTLSFVERAHLEQTAERLHFALVWIMMTLVALHVGAALKHHFVDRDDVLARMIPALSRNRSAGAAVNTREASQAKGAM
jgi:cytochrome b561